MSKNFKEYKKRNNVLKAIGITIMVVFGIAAFLIGLEFGGIYAIIAVPIVLIIEEIVFKVDSYYFHYYFEKDCKEAE